MSQITDNVKTFSIGFEQETYNEAPDARIVAEKYNTDHHEKIIDSEKIINLIPQLTKEMDEPFGDLSIFPTYLVSKFAREHVTVALSGDGGDELFAGYDWYLANKIYSSYRLFPGSKLILPPVLKRFKQTSQSKGIINKAKRFTEGALMPKDWQHLRWMTSFTPLAQKQIYSNKVNALSFSNSLNPSSSSNLSNPFDLAKGYADQVKGKLNKSTYVDIKTYLPDDILTKVDRASMLNSLEARVPFLDHNFVEFASSIPENYKLNGFDCKHILKKAMLPYLPKQILYKKKQGFTMPMKHWLRKELKSYMQEVLSPKNIKETGILDNDYVQNVIKQHLNKTRDNQRHIWAMMSFQLWYKRYIQN